MNLETRKLEFIKEFLSIENEETILLMEELLIVNKEPKSQTFKPLTIEQLKARINQSLGDSENDRVISSDQLRKEVQTWS